MELWFTEKYKDLAGLTIRVSRHLHHEKTEFQTIDVFETPGFGKILTLDGLIMVTEKDEFVYHEALVHPAMVYSPQINKVLVAGGGDGGSVREILKYEDVKEVDVVEIDKRVVEVSKQFFPQLASSFESEKVKLIHQDITEFINSCEQYDVIILDTSDPVGPAEALYREEFYKRLKNCISADGAISIQSESPWWQEETIKRLTFILTKNFNFQKFYTAPVISYPGGLWLFSLVADSELQPHRKLPDELKFVTESFISSLHIPPFIEELLI